MPTDDLTEDALAIGKKQANSVLKYRAQALQTREEALDRQADRIEIRTETLELGREAILTSGILRTAGVLVAEGDSWFDYPFHDVLEILEDDRGYDIETVAHKGDPIEEMAYGGNQLEELTRRLEKLLRRGVTPKAILFSGGGNDVAGQEFGMLLNHASSAIAGLNEQVVDGVVNRRIRAAYITILSAVTHVCDEKLGRRIPILVHGYDYPVPDGRGYLGGWWLLPGPWLEPGFRTKGYEELQRRIVLARELIDRFNEMLGQVAGLQPFAHVTYIDLRGSLSQGTDYKDWWDNELHPTKRGFRRVTDRFHQVLQALP